MHEFAADALVDALNHTQAVERLAAPLPSEYRSANDCVEPSPALGCVLSVVTASGVPGTAHDPRVIQPPVVAPVALAAYILTLFVPPKVGANVSDSVSVSVDPLPTAEVPASIAIAHWLFSSVPPLPMLADSHCVPESLSNDSVC